LPKSGTVGQNCAEDAASHIGDAATVCGVVALTNFDADTPDQVFAAVIYGGDRAKFRTPKTARQGERVCVSGVIREDRGTPEIALTDPRQLTQ
jgi:hypothetical protein